jgi:uncharacterized phage protein (TIGR01671 family)
MKYKNIKYRAWNKHWGMMSYDIDKIIFEKGKAVEISITIPATDYDHKGEWVDYEIGKDIILMQYVGLKDKNGKEIYEGDIVKGKWGAKQTIWLEPFDVADYEDSYAGFGFYLQTHGVEDFAESVEVLGNVFENPDLVI